MPTEVSIELGNALHILDSKIVHSSLTEYRMSLMSTYIPSNHFVNPIPYSLVILNTVKLFK